MGYLSPRCYIYLRIIPEQNSLSLKNPHLMRVSGNEGGLTEEFLFRNGPEVSSREMLRGSTRL